MARRTTIGGGTGLFGAAIGGYLGYRQAIEIGMDPAWQGALILGALGFVLGSIGGYILKTISAVFIYLILLGVFAFFLNDEVEMLTGIDPREAAITIFGDLGDMMSGNGNP